MPSIWALLLKRKLFVESFSRSAKVGRLFPGMIRAVLWVEEGLTDGFD